MTLPDSNYIAAALARRTAVAAIAQPPMTAATNLTLTSGGSIKNSAGTTLFDSSGLVAASVFPILGINISGSWSVSSNTVIALSPNSVTFTLSRRIPILVFASGFAQMSGSGGGQLSQVTVAIDGSPNTNPFTIGSNFDQAITGAVPFAFTGMINGMLGDGGGPSGQGVVSGTHVFQLASLSGAGTSTLTVINGVMLVLAGGT